MHPMADTKTSSAGLDTDTLKRRILARGWFDGAAPEAANQLLELCVWRHFSPGQSVFRIESESADLYVVAEGQVAVTQHFHGHLDAANIHLYRAGEWFGYTPIIRGAPRRIQTMARTDCVLAVIPELRLRSFLADHPEHWQLMALIADSQGIMNGLAALDLSRRSPLERLCGALLRMAGCRQIDGPDGPPFDVTASQTELAEASNLSRNATALLLRQMEKEGLVALHYRRLTLLRPDRLRTTLDMT